MKKKKNNFFWKLLMGIAICVFCFSAYQLFHICRGYKTGVDEYKHMEQEAVIENTEPLEPILEKENISLPDKPEVYPPEVNFEKLKATNEDVVGWLYLEGLEDISYPIVQGKDNEYYLHRTVKRTENFAGSIFIDADNTADFTDPNTIIYGHNMKNGSMFGKLKWMLEKELYKKSKYFWISTPEGKYRYEIFSMQYVDAVSDTYTLFSSQDENFEKYIRKMKEQSKVELENENLGKDEYVVTLSTCTSNKDIRFVVQGRWIGTY